MSTNILAANNSLLQAIRTSDLAAMQTAFDKGAQPDAPEALWKAAGTGRTEVVQALFDRGATEVNQIKSHGSECKKREFTIPLSNAVHKGHIDVAAMLLAKGAKIERPAVKSALLQGNAPMALLLVQRGFSLRDNFFEGRPEVVPLINGARAIECDGSLAHDAAASGNVELTRTIYSCLRSTKENVFNCEGKTPLHVAVAKDKPEVVKALLELGADIHANMGISPLELSVRLGHVECARILLQAGARGDRDPLLCLAVATGNPDMLHLLVSNIGYISGVNLCSALSKGKSIVEMLLDAYVNQSDGPNGSALHHACNPKIVPGDVFELLLSRRADINALSPHGTTPLYEAVRHAHVNAVRALLFYNTQKVDMKAVARVERLDAFGKVKQCMQDRIVERFPELKAAYTKIFVMLLAKQTLLSLEGLPPFQEKQAFQTAFTRILNTGGCEELNNDEMALLQTGQIPCVIEFFAGLTSNS